MYKVINYYDLRDSNNLEIKHILLRLAFLERKSSTEKNKFRKNVASGLFVFNDPTKDPVHAVELSGGFGSSALSHSEKKVLEKLAKKIAGRDVGSHKYADTFTDGKLYLFTERHPCTKGEFCCNDFLNNLSNKINLDIYHILPAEQDKKKAPDLLEKDFNDVGDDFDISDNIDDYIKDVLLRMNIAYIPNTSTNTATSSTTTHTQPRATAITSSSTTSSTVLRSLKTSSISKSLLNPPRPPGLRKPKPEVITKKTTPAINEKATENVTDDSSPTSSPPRKKTKM